MRFSFMPAHIIFVRVFRPALPSSDAVGQIILIKHSVAVAKHSGEEALRLGKVCYRMKIFLVKSLCEHTFYKRFTIDFIYYDRYIGIASDMMSEFFI